MGSQHLLPVIFLLLVVQVDTDHAAITEPHIDATLPASNQLAPGFWDHWGDGRAEIDGYSLTQPRYGELRRGTAVAIFVTETMNASSRVKTDSLRPRDGIPVMKLNLLKDFQTGIYDYQTMLTVFWSLESHLDREPGSAAKAVFSSQEWCGQVFHEILPGRDDVHSISHSYFEGEGDQSLRIGRPADGILRDELFFLVRGFIVPGIERGDSIQRSLLTSLETARLAHTDLTWQTVEIRRSSETHGIDVAAGTFDVDRYSVGNADGNLLSIDVEVAPPHRIIRWETRAGEIAELTGTTRVAYWQLQKTSDVTHLKDLGLAPPTSGAAGGFAP